MKKLMCVCAIAFVACTSFGDAVKFGVLVLDSQTNLPVPGAGIKAGFEEDRGVWSRDRYKCTFKQYVSDSNGYARVQGTSNNGEAGATIVSAEGYYTPAHSDIPRFRKKNLFGVWQPDDLVVTIKLQRVEHPIPLWVKKELLNVKQEITNITGEKFSYDLMMGEWLPPLGKGKVADIEFTRIPHQEFAEVVGASGVKGRPYRDAVAVKFMGADNGLVESHIPSRAYLKVRAAPEEGYNPDYLCWEGKDDDLRHSTNYDRNRCFCFRIRTQRNENGQVKKAYYGKIYGDIVAYTGSDHAVFGVLFTYYLNPTSLDRNLEWDRVHNLCPNPGDVGDHVGDRQP